MKLTTTTTTTTDSKKSTEYVATISMHDGGVFLGLKASLTHLCFQKHIFCHSSRITQNFSPKSIWLKRVGGGEFQLKVSILEQGLLSLSW